MNGRYLAVVVLIVIASQSLGRATVQQTSSPAFTIDGDIALWTMAIKPDKTADFEHVMTKLREALSKSDDPTRRAQLKGWKVMRVKNPLPDGNIAYVHIINPVIAGADYTIMQSLYDAFPDERQALYDLYRGAFAANLSLAAGTVVLDMNTAPGSSSAPAQ
jgi:hypothetical protein